VWGGLCGGEKDRMGRKGKREGTFTEGEFRCLGKEGSG